MSPIAYRREGSAMVPLPRFQSEFFATFETGKVYRLAEVEERSSATHNHFFASLHDAWSNLPEEYGQEFASPEHLRKYALIKTGFFDRRSIVAASKAEAQRLAAFMRPMDDFALILVNESEVTVYTAKSQSMRAMGKVDFARSKEAVLGLISEMIGVEVGALKGEAGQAA